MQAASAAMIEGILRPGMEKPKKRIRRKRAFTCVQGSVPDMGIFSPKLPEGMFLNALDAGKHLGIKLTDSFLDDAFPNP